MGAALTDAFAQRGDCVSVLGRSGPNTSRRKGDITHVVVDLADRSEVEAATRQLAKTAPIQNLVFAQRYRGTADPWEAEIAVSLAATRALIENLAHAFVAGSSIVVVSSVAGDFIASEQGPGYHASKAALNHLVRYFAVAFGPKGVRCNTVSPSIFIKEESEAYHEDEQRMRFYRSVVPLQRAATAAEVCNVILFLCSPAASYVTGQNIFVDGGLSVQAHLSLARHVAEQL